MTDYLTTEKVLSYILGELSETEQLAMEDLLFSTDENYRMLIDLKEQLIDDYVCHRLSQEDCRKFEKQFLTSLWRRRRTVFALALSNYITGGN